MWLYYLTFVILYHDIMNVRVLSKNFLLKVWCTSGVFG